METSPSQSPAKYPISRQEYVNIIDAAVFLEELNFAHQLSVSWLAKYPGDLPIKNNYANILMKEGKSQLAWTIIEEVVEADPEFPLAVNYRLQIARQLLNNHRSKQKQTPHSHYSPPKDITDLIQWKHALIGNAESSFRKEKLLNSLAWGDQLFWVNKILAGSQSTEQHYQTNIEKAERTLVTLLAQKPDIPIVAVSHLRLFKLRVDAGIAPKQTMISLAYHYHQKFPHCLPCALYLAAILFDNSHHDDAVRILHNCTSQDITGQVAQRIFGDEHQYREMWPVQYTSIIDIPIPASIAAYFGWNQLPAGEIIENQNDSNKIEIPQNADLDQISDSNLIETDIESHTKEDMHLADTVKIIIDNDKNDRFLNESKSLFGNFPSKNTNGSIDKTNSPTQELSELQDIRGELERLSTRLKRPNIMIADGRFPTYVIMTTHQGLESRYGLQQSNHIEKEILNLISIIRLYKTWNAVLFYADTGSILPAGKLVSEPVKFNDPWALKLGLIDLEKFLNDHGEMIGAVLIVGDNNIVPFHQLPNPIDDADEYVPSDNPYSTRDVNYFISDWPVGRIPTPNDDDGGFVLKFLRNITLSHKLNLHTTKQSGRISSANILIYLRRLLSRFSNNGYHPTSFGYTAAAWRRASYEVYRPIGDPSTILVSPPLIGNSQKTTHRQNTARYWQRGLKPKVNQTQISTNPVITLPDVYVPPVQFGYFNLHGLINSADWYGQSDLLDLNFDSLETIEYPIALKPIDIAAKGQNSPRVVFSEACYGANIFEKSIKDAMLYAFLNNGCQAYIGSTCISYGAIGSPLTAADFLGRAFWIGIQKGLSTGESLRKAKIDLAREMVHNQGYLDGEDQKTLISFVLYGDPLAHPNQVKPLAKDLFRSQKKFDIPITMRDQTQEILIDQEFSIEMIDKVKTFVERYLPGMKNAHMTVCSEPILDITNNHHHAGKSIQGQKSQRNPDSIEPNHSSISHSGRKIVIFHKESKDKLTQHEQYARLTLDEQGQVVKLVVSR